MYGLTSRGIVDALITAKNRGVDVAIKTDKTETQGKAQSALIVKLHAAGVPVEVSTQQRHLHHKFTIDVQQVITGSLNWTQNAEQRNRENLVILDCREIAAAFEREWQSIQQHAP